MSPTPVYENVKTERIKRGKTQAQVAAALKLDEGSYCRLEKGKRNLLAEEARTVAKFLRIHVSRLFRDNPPQAQAS